MIQKTDDKIISAFLEAFGTNSNVELHENSLFGQPIPDSDIEKVYSQVNKNKLTLVWVNTDWQILRQLPKNLIMLHPCQIYPVERIFFRPPIVYMKHFEPLSKGEKPTIGFCGHGGDSDRVVAYFRKNILRILQSHPGLDCKFIIRDNFTGQNVEEKLTAEFEENMQNCIFNFCNRGAGPYAIRLYETLSAGRIPIFMTEETSLCSKAPYHEACIIAKNPYEMLDKIITTFENEDIQAMQLRARKLYENFFDLPAYFKTLKRKMGI